MTDSLIPIMLFILLFVSLLFNIVIRIFYKNKEQKLLRRINELKERYEVDEWAEQKTKELEAIK